MLNLSCRFAGNQYPVLNSPLPMEQRHTKNAHRSSTPDGFHAEIKQPSTRIISYMACQGLKTESALKTILTGCRGDRETTPGGIPMSKNRWLWIGCGGCLGLVIVLVLALFAGGFALTRYVKTIQSQKDEWDRKVRTLDQAHPFTPPSPPSLNPQRYEEFLAVRSRAAASVDQNLGWLIELSQDAASPKESASWLSLVKRFIHLPFDLFAAGEDQLTALAQTRMSMREYVHLTQVTAGAMNQWRQREKGDPREAIAQAYLKPILDLDENLKKHQQQNPQSHVDIGPFDKESFLHILARQAPPPREIDELIYAAGNRIVSASSAVFLDAITLQTRNEVLKPHAPAGEVESEKSNPGTSPSRPDAMIDDPTEKSP